jgi:hypothetical protein
VPSGKKPSAEVMGILCSYELAIRDAVGTAENPGVLIEDLDVLETFTACFTNRLAEHFAADGIEFDKEAVWERMGVVAVETAEARAAQFENDPEAFLGAFA